MSLITVDPPGLLVDDVPAARLGVPSALVALRKPSPARARLDLRPRHILQQQGPIPRGQVLRRRALAALATLVVHLGFGAAFLLLLSWRSEPPVEETAIPIEVVSHIPEPPAAKPPPEKVKSSATPAPEVERLPPPSMPQPPQITPRATPPMAALEPPQTGAPPQPIQPNPPQPAAQPQPAAKPALVAPPPEPTRAATQTSVNKVANLEPDLHQVDAATHESRPAERTQPLTTMDPKASFAVPPPAEAKPDPLTKPTPAIPAKAPSETDKLAAALPMDTSAMPMSFRAVLSGNGSQVSTAYKGLVYGRFKGNASIAERARSLHLKGQVIVAFSIDDAGQVQNLSVLQTSGSDVLDALGLDMVRSGAPYPAPPPGAAHSFTPAFAFGE